MPRIGGKEVGSAVFMILLIAIIGLYLASNLFVKSGTEWKFDISQYKDSTTMNVLKIAIVGIAVWGAYVLFVKLNGGAMSSRDYWTVAIIAILVILLWDKVLVKVFSGKPLNEITFAVGQKMGMFP